MRLCTKFKYLDRCIILPQFNQNSASRWFVCKDKVSLICIHPAADTTYSLSVSTGLSDCAIRLDFPFVHKEEKVKSAVISKN